MEEFIEQAADFLATAPEDVAVVMEIADLDAVAAARPRLSGWAAAKKDVFDWAGRQGNRVWNLILRGRMGLQGVGKLRKAGRIAIRFAAIFVVQPWVNNVVIHKAVPALIRFNKREEARMVKLAEKVHLGGAMRAMWAPNRWLMKVLDEHATKWWMLPVLGIPGAAAAFALLWFAGDGAKRALRRAAFSLASEVVAKYVYVKWLEPWFEQIVKAVDEAADDADLWNPDTDPAFNPQAAPAAEAAPKVVDGTVVQPEPVVVAPIDPVFLAKLNRTWGNLEFFKVVNERPAEAGAIQALMDAASKNSDYHRVTVATTNTWLPDYLYNAMPEQYTQTHAKVITAVASMKGDYVLTTVAARTGCTTDDLIATTVTAILLRNRMKISNSEVAKHLRLAVESAYVLQDRDTRLSNIRAEEEQATAATGTTAA